MMIPNPFLDKLQYDLHRLVNICALLYNKFSSIGVCAHRIYSSFTLKRQANTLYLCKRRAECSTDFIRATRMCVISFYWELIARRQLCHFAISITILQTTTIANFFLSIHFCMPFNLYITLQNCIYKPQIQ